MIRDGSVLGERIVDCLTFLNLIAHIPKIIRVEKTERFVQKMSLWREIITLYLLRYLYKNSHFYLFFKEDDTQSK